MITFLSSFLMSVVVVLISIIVTHINDILLNTTYLIAVSLCVVGGWVPLNKINNISCVHLLVSMKTPSHPLALTSPRLLPLAEIPQPTLAEVLLGRALDPHMTQPHALGHRQLLS